jgi:hypothetical protein
VLSPSAKAPVRKSAILILLVCTAPALADDTECKTAYGKTACGFHCTAGFSDVQCSETYEGACLAAFGRVMCWDPPPRYRRLACEREPAQCLAAFGDIACGYGCTAGFGEVKCSPRPGGTCEAADGHVTCAR